MYRVAFRVEDDSIAGRLRDIRDGWRVGLSVEFPPGPPPLHAGSEAKLGP